MGRAHDIGASRMAGDHMGPAHDVGTSRVIRDDIGRVHDAGMTRDEADRTQDAAGMCRRARAPSRRAMEASGQAEGEGAQWMTKDKREERARLSEKLKRQRRAAAAAGLKAGEVLEEYQHVPPPATPELDGGLLPWGAADSCDGSGKNGGLAWEEAADACDNDGGRNTSPRNGSQRGIGGKANPNETALTLRGSKTKHHPANSWNRRLARDGAAPAGASRNCAGTLSNFRNGTDAEVGCLATVGSMAAHRDFPRVSKIRRPVGEKKREGQTEQGGRRGYSRDGRGNGSRGGVEVGGGGTCRRNEIAREAKCEFQTCSKMATFGVNLTVRYW